MMKVLHARPGKNERDKPFWTQVGVAFRSRQGDGSVNVILNYLPLTPDKDGAVRLVLKEDDGERKPRPAPQDYNAPLDDAAEMPF